MIADWLLHVGERSIAYAGAVDEDLGPRQGVDVQGHPRDCKRDRGSASCQIR